MACEICGKNFKVRRALAMHQTVMHRELFASGDAPVEEVIERSTEASTSATPDDFRITGYSGHYSFCDEEYALSRGVVVHVCDL